MREVGLPRALAAVCVLFLGWTCVCRYVVVGLLGGTDGNIELLIAQEYGNAAIALLVLRRLPQARLLPLLGPAARGRGGRGGRGGAVRACAGCLALVVACCALVLPALEGAMDRLGVSLSGSGVQGAIDSLTLSSLTPEGAAVDLPSFPSAYLRVAGAAYRHACDGVAIFGLAFLAPVWEELVFRGTLMRAVLSRLSAGRAAGGPRRLAASVLASAAVFAAMHLDDSVGTFIAHVSIGCVLGAAYALASWLAAGLGEAEKRGGGAPAAVAIAVPIAIHAVWNLRCSAFEILSAT